MSFLKKFYFIFLSCFICSGAATETADTSQDDDMKISESTVNNYYVYADYDDLASLGGLRHDLASLGGLRHNRDTYPPASPENTYQENTYSENTASYGYPENTASYSYPENSVEPTYGSSDFLVPYVHRTMGKGKSLLNRIVSKLKGLMNFGQNSNYKFKNVYALLEDPGYGSSDPYSSGGYPQSDYQQSYEGHDSQYNPPKISGEITGYTYMMPSGYGSQDNQYPRIIGTRPATKNIFQDLKNHFLNKLNRYKKTLPSAQYGSSSNEYGSESSSYEPGYGAGQNRDYPKHGYYVLRPKAKLKNLASMLDKVVGYKQNMIRKIPLRFAGTGSYVQSSGEPVYGPPSEEQPTYSPYSHEHSPSYGPPPEETYGAPGYDADRTVRRTPSGDGKINKRESNVHATPTLNLEYDHAPLDGVKSTIRINITPDEGKGMPQILSNREKPVPATLLNKVKRGLATPSARDLKLSYSEEESEDKNSKNNAEKNHLYVINYYDEYDWMPRNPFEKFEANHLEPNPLTTEDQLPLPSESNTHISENDSFDETKMEELDASEEQQPSLEDNLVVPGPDYNPTDKDENVA